jgi:hypothetical protein
VSLHEDIVGSMAMLKKNYDQDHFVLWVFYGAMAAATASQSTLIWWHCQTETLLWIGLFWKVRRVIFMKHQKWQG